MIALLQGYSRQQVKSFTTLNLKNNFDIMHLQEEFYKKLKKDKIKINSNKNPIKMSLFLSFLKVKVKRCTEFLGSYTNWTQLENTKHNLIITGGVVNSVEYLDSLQYGVRLDNPYNNYVNAFYLFEILNNKGQKYFLEYYKEDINNILKESSKKIKQIKTQLKKSEELQKELQKEIERLYSEVDKNEKIYT